MILQNMLLAIAELTVMAMAMCPMAQLALLGLCDIRTEEKGAKLNYEWVWNSTLYGTVSNSFRPKCNGRSDSTGRGSALISGYHLIILSTQTEPNRKRNQMRS